MRRILACFGLCFLGAQLAAAYLPSAAFVLLAAGFAVFWWVCRRWYRRWAAPAAVLALAASVALAQHGAAVWLCQAPLERYTQQPHSLELRVESAQPAYREDFVRGLATVLSVDGKVVSFKVYCPALPLCEPGEVVRGQFSLGPPSQPEYRLSNYADGAYLQADYEGGFEAAGEADGLAYRLARLRHTLTQGLRRNLPQPYAALLAAMTVGEKSGLSRAQTDLFRQAGISHLLVVSGLHLSLVCGLLAGGMRPAGRYRKLRAGAGILVALAFAAITGFTPSVCRACIALVLYDVGVLAGLPADPITSLGAAALALGLANPYAACDVGLQLSFCATLGVLGANQVIRRLANSRQGAGRLYMLACGAAGLLLPPLFAALATLPVQLLQGLPLSGVAVLANVLVLYLVPPLLACGLGAALTGLFPWLGTVCRCFALVGGILTKCLVGIAQWAASLPFARFTLPVGYTVFAWGLLFFLACLYWKSRRWKHMFWVVPACAVFAWSCGAVASRGLVEVTLLGSTSAPCAVFCQHGQAAVLFQGGAANEQEIQAFLAERGIERPQLVIDLRQSPELSVFEGAHCLQAREADIGQGTSAPFCGILFKVYHTKQGNLVLADIQGYTLAMAAGTPQWPRHLPCDVLLAGSRGKVGDLRPACAVVLGHSALEGAYTLGGSRPMVQLRPGCSVRFLEVERC